MEKTVNTKKKASKWGKCEKKRKAFFVVVFDSRKNVLRKNPPPIARR